MRSVVVTVLDKIKADMRNAEKLIDRLNAKGYLANFILDKDRLRCVQTGDTYLPCEINVDMIYRIDDEELGLNGLLIYAVSKSGGMLKGLFITQQVTKSDE